MQHPNRAIAPFGLANENMQSRQQRRGAQSYTNGRSPGRPSLGLDRWIEVDTGYLTPCWVWAGPKTPAGYGTTRWRGKFTTAHRAVWQEAHGPMTAGHALEVDHLCRVLACVRLAHLEAVTPLVNQRRNPNSHTNKTHCPRGHEYTPENTYRSKTGARFCRTCARAADRVYRERQTIALTRSDTNERSA